MLKKRILTALISLPLVFAVLYYTPKTLIGFVFLVLAMACTYELASIIIPSLREKLSPEKPSTPRLWFLLSTAASAAVFTSLAFRPAEYSHLGIAIFSIMLLLALSNYFSKTIEEAVANMLGTSFSVIYGCLPWACCLDLYELGENSRYIFLLLGIVMANDSGAYFVGKYLGKHSLAPLASPKKTWEGVFGGLLCGIFGAFVISFVFSVFDSALGPWEFLVVAALITGASGIIGDLTESALKRFSNVKDSGSLFPGHGGILDRTDSIVFAAPTLWFLLYLMKQGLLF